MKFLVSVLLIAFGIAVQVNSSEAFLWTYFRPTSTTMSATASSSSNSSAPVADVIGTVTFSTGDLEGSNAVLSIGKNISTNVVQTFYAPLPETTTVSSVTTTAATTTAATTTAATATT